MCEMCAEIRREEETDSDVLANSQWDGVPSRGKVCTQRSCCQKLHVSCLNNIPLAIIMTVAVVLNEVSVYIETKGTVDVADMFELGTFVL